jgi:hypothetical protein
VPDLQSELKKLETLAFDDEGSPTTEITMPKQTFKPVNNVSRETFNYIKNNPGTTRALAVRALENLGYKPSSTASLIGQFVRQGLMRQTNGAVFAAASEYAPIKATPKKVAKVTAKKVQEAIMETPVPIAVSHDTSVKTMLSRMSVLQAREMYDELKKIFAS